MAKSEVWRQTEVSIVRISKLKLGSLL